MSTKTPTGMFPSVGQLQSGDIDFKVRNTGLVDEGRHFEGISKVTTDPVACDPSVVGSDKNRKIVEKQAEELARQYAGVYKPGF